MIKNYVDIDTKLDKVNDECGVFGIYRNDDDIDVVAAANDALFSLQHRGQQSAGITVNKDGEFTTVKELGMVSEIFTPKALEKLPNGKIAVGHVRYTSSESLDRASNQPLVMRYIQGSIGIASNGSITNFNEIRQELETGGAVFQSNSNAEIMAYVIATERCVTDTLEDAVLSSMRKLKGAYSTVICAPSRLIGFRDMHGFRPLCIGKLKNSWIFTSESCVIDSLGGEFVRDVEPGEMVVVDEEGFHSYKLKLLPDKTSFCLFEYVYSLTHGLCQCNFLRKIFPKNISIYFNVIINYHFHCNIFWKYSLSRLKPHTKTIVLSTQFPLLYTEHRPADICRNFVFAYIEKQIYARIRNGFNTVFFLIMNRKFIKV